VLVAAQRDMIERLLGAARDAGLHPEGVDLSAFALIRSLYRPDPEHMGRVLYLNVDGLTNMAIAEGTICRFTRVVGGGIEAMASELAERRSVPLVEARALIASVDLTVPEASEQITTSVPEIVPSLPAAEEIVPASPVAEELASDAPAVESIAADRDALESEADQEAREQAMSYAEMTAVAPTVTPDEEQPTAITRLTADADVRAVLENGIREIAGEVRNSLDFHRSQEGGGEVTLVVLSGAALDLPGFGEALQEQLGVQVQRESVHMDEHDVDGVSAHRLAIATGLAVEEALR
jgi:Tfp pilus assembly PilM family ATPase